MMVCCRMKRAPRNASCAALAATRGPDAVIHPPRNRTDRRSAKTAWMDDYEVLWLDEPTRSPRRRGSPPGPCGTARTPSPSPTIPSSAWRCSTARSADAGRGAVGRCPAGHCVLGVAGAVPPGHCIDSMLPPEIRTPDHPPPVRPTPIDSCTADRSWPRTTCPSPTGMSARRRGTGFPGDGPGPSRHATSV